MGWVLAAAVAVMFPALHHGLSLGEYDWLSSYGLLLHPGVLVHNGFGGDQINEMIPWTTLAWTQVHHGQLPLWNPYSALGMPLAFNWQSAVFSLPNLIGYLFPVRLMYTVQVMATLFIAGTGAYVLGRVLRLSVVACALAGTVFELSGPFFVWLGWPIASVLSWTGWLFAAVVLIVRGRHKIRDVAFFSVAFAFAVYAGEPDTLILLVGALTVFALVLLAVRVKQAGGIGPVVEPFRNLVIALVAGTFLGAPLLLPGLQLISRSIRNTSGSGLNAQSALSVDYLFRTAFPWLIGAPIVHEYKYIGVIAIVLALTGVVFRFRQPEVAALAVVVVVTGIVVFVPAAISVINALPGLHAVRLPRALNFFTFGVAMLSAVGLQVFLRSPGNRSVIKFIAAAFGVAALALAVFWVTDWHHLSLVQHAIRRRGITWLLVGVAVGLVVVAVDVVAARRHWPLGHAGGSEEQGGSTPPIRSEAVDGNGAARGRDHLSHRERHGVVDVELHAVRAHTRLAGAQAGRGVGPGRTGHATMPVPTGTGHPGQRQHRVRGPRAGRLRPDGPPRLLHRLEGEHRRAARPADGLPLLPRRHVGHHRP